MPFRPDFFIVEAGSPTKIMLVVEAKLGTDSKEAGESQLKQFMLAMSCPVGLLVTPTQISIYRDTYTERSEGSIERMGPYPVPSNWAVAKAVGGGGARELEFEQRVRSWLEQVSSSRTVKGLPREASDAFDSYVIPALSSGLIRGSGPAIRESN